MNTRVHLYGLDLIRFLSALGVALFHLTWQLRAPPLQLKIGWIGVEIFFVLSGFVIAGSAEGSSASGFMKRRFERLYPAAWICTLFCSSLMVALGGHSLVAATVAPSPTTMFDSLSLLSEPFIASAFWTLPIELAFYALVACLLWLGLFDVRRLAMCLILWSALFLAIVAADHLGLIHAPWTNFETGAWNVTLLRHGVYFGLGLLLWAEVERPSRHILTRSWIGGAIALAWVEIACRSYEIAPMFKIPTRFIELVVPAFWFGLPPSQLSMRPASRRTACDCPA